MEFSIAYFTNRKDPKIEWFAYTLKKEIESFNFAPAEIIIVDYYADEDGRRKFIQEKLGNWTALTPKLWHIPPKPCAVQGKHRKTSRNHFAAANARNTAFARCSNDYIVCVDDLSALNRGWLNQISHAMEHKYCVLGAYKKVLNLIVDPSGAISFNHHPPGVDSRWNSGSDAGIVRAAGSWLFGCSFGLPIEFAERVNGFDEACDMQGAEDYDFGIRLERAGAKIFYNRNLMTWESEEEHHSPGNEKFTRESKLMFYDGGMIGSDHVMLRRVMRENRSWTIGNDFTLSDLRKQILAGGQFPIPTREIDWRTDKPFE
jgi:hypothetical protein